MADTLDPKQARARFGTLKHPATRTYMEFEEDDGIWRPEMLEGALKAYRLYPAPRGVKTTWRRGQRQTQSPPTAKLCRTATLISLRLSSGSGTLTL